MIEVTEGLRLSGHLTDFTNYRFYKFFKACKDSCDLDIVLSPQQLYVNLDLLVMTDLGNGSLPTLSKFTQWSKKVNTDTNLKITA
jgi:hypothetical protein